MRPVRAQGGFSLVELITVILILGVLAAGGGLLIARPIEAYDDIVRRQQLVDQGEMALRQIARDVRRALPNSLRVTAVGSGFAVEMMNTVDGARYRDENATGVGDASDVLDFTAGDTSFNLLGLLNSPAAFDAENRMVIYNTSAATLYQDAALDNDPGIISPSTVNIDFDPAPNYANEHQITLDAAFQFSQQSPGQRIFFVDTPISYVCNPASGEMIRYRDYSITSAQPTAPLGGSSATVITQLAGCEMTYSAGSAQRGGVLTVEISIDNEGESINLLHQIHVVNVP